MSDSLKRAVQLAEQLAQMQRDIDVMEQELKDAKEAMRTVQREDLPMLMAELGLSEFKLNDGSVVTVKEEVDCAITEERRPEAYAWLIKNGFSGLIKTKVAVQFDRGAREQAAMVAEELAKELEGVVLEEVVAAPTLKAFVKEQLAAGKAIPFDLFGIFPYNIAKVQSPKKAKRS